MTKAEATNQNEQIVEPIDNSDLKGATDTTWSWMDKEERAARFTAAHKGITEDAVIEAWEATHSTNGTAKHLGCSRPNARRWLLKLGFVQPTEAEQRKIDAKAAKAASNATKRGAPKPAETDIIAETIAMSIAMAIEDEE